MPSVAAVRRQPKRRWTAGRDCCKSSVDTSLPGISAADQIVDIFKQRFDAGIEFIQVGDDRNFGGARPSGGLGGSRGVVAVKVKCARVDDPIALQFFRAKGEAVVAPPQDGALARIVHKEECLLTVAIRRGEQMRFNAEAREFRSVPRSRAVPAHLADVARTESPLLAGDESGGGLAAG